MRVDVARALLLNQLLVVFDEFTNVVDREVARKNQGIIFCYF